MQKLKHLSSLYLWILVAIITIWLGSYSLYSSSKENLYQSSLKQHSKTINHGIQGVIEERRASAIAIALALAEIQIFEAFCVIVVKPNLIKKLVLIAYWSK